MPKKTGFCLERAVCRTGVMSSCLCVNKLHSAGHMCLEIQGSVWKELCV